MFYYILKYICWFVIFISAVSYNVWVTIRLITKQSDISEFWKNWNCLGFVDEDCCGVWRGSPSPQAEFGRISGLP
jgi:hypothetical protein